MIDSDELYDELKEVLGLPAKEKIFSLKIFLKPGHPPKIELIVNVDQKLHGDCLKTLMDFEIVKKKE